MSWPGLVQYYIRWCLGSCCRRIWRTKKLPMIALMFLVNNVSVSRCFSHEMSNTRRDRRMVQIKNHFRPGSSGIPSKTSGVCLKKKWQFSGIGVISILASYINSITTIFPSVHCLIQITEITLQMTSLNVNCWHS